jgi:hypothetical protein
MIGRLQFPVCVVVETMKEALECDVGSVGIVFIVSSDDVGEGFCQVDWPEKNSYMKQDAPIGMDWRSKSFFQAVRIRRASVMVN